MSATASEAVLGQVAALYRRRAFHPIARFLPEEHREDRLAEAVALTLVMALRYAARGQRLDDALLIHHARLRAIDPSRHLVSSKGRGLDALNQANFIDGKVEVLHIDGVVDTDGEGDQQLIGLAVRLNADPSEKLASAFDLGRWLEELPARDQRLLKLRASGLALREIAAELGMSISQVCTRCRTLGLELAGGMGVDPPKARSRRVLH